jgi:hypothetical protein
MLIGPLPASSQGAVEELSREELSQLEAEAERWVREFERKQRPLARSLTAGEKRALERHFGAELLDRARVREVERIDNPEFYTSFFAERGRPLPIDFRQASGLALLDTILIVTPRVPPRSPGWLPLLFHELVHLVQVEVEGRDEHVAAYVRGWASRGFEYRSIPQEEQAFELAARFRAAPKRPFSVVSEVARRFAAAAGEAGDETAKDQQP